MHTPLVRFQLPDGRLSAVQAGGIIGRLASATLRIDDPRVSEAHALVSLRGEDLCLLALRGPLGVGGKEVRQATLHPGLRIRLADGVEILVESVVLPEAILVVELPDGRVHPLYGEVMSVVDERHPAVISRFDEAALVRLWTSGIGWRGLPRGGRAFDVRAGSEVEVAGVHLRFDLRAVAELSASTTAGVGLDVAIRVRTTLDELRISASDRPLLQVGGIPARIVRELADYQEPVPWEDVAIAVLGKLDEVRLRANWDRNLKTLRGKLAGGGYRTDLVRSDRHGKVGIFLRDGDTLEVI